MHEFRGPPICGPDPFNPGSGLGSVTVASTITSAPFVARVPDAARHPQRVKRATEKLAAVFNALARKGYLVQTGLDTYSLNTGPAVLPTQPNLTPGTYQVTGATITVDGTGVITNILPSPTPIYSVNNIRPIAAVAMTDPANVAATETTLHTASVTGGLLVGGTTVHANYTGEWGIITGSTDTVTLYIDSTAVQTISTGPPSTSIWDIRANFFYQNSTTLRYVSHAVYTSGTPTPTIRIAYGTVASNPASGFTVKVTGQTNVSNTGDIVLHTGDVYWKAGP